MTADEALRRDTMANWDDTPKTEGISFGPLHTQVLLPEVASAVLTLWCKRAPATFGGYLAEVLTGQKPTGRRT